MKASKSKSLSIFNCVVPTPSAFFFFCWAAAWRRDVWCCFSKWLQGSGSGLHLTLFSSLLSLSLSPSLKWNDRSLIVSANTKEPKGCNSSPRGVFGWPIRAGGGSSPLLDEDVDKSNCVVKFFLTYIVFTTMSLKCTDCFLSCCLEYFIPSKETTLTSLTSHLYINKDNLIQVMTYFCC